MPTVGAQLLLLPGAPRSSACGLGTREAAEERVSFCFTHHRPFTTGEWGGVGGAGHGP